MPVAVKQHYLNIITKAILHYLNIIKAILHERSCIQVGNREKDDFS